MVHYLFFRGNTPDKDLHCDNAFHWQARLTKGAIIAIPATLGTRDYLVPGVRLIYRMVNLGSEPPLVLSNRNTEVTTDTRCFLAQ